MPDPAAIYLSMSISNPGFRASASFIAINIIQETN